MIAPLRLFPAAAAACFLTIWPARLPAQETPAAPAPEANPEAAPDISPPPAAPAPLSVEEIAERTRPALVAIYPGGRRGGTAGVGSGFVISADGLIATNLHVIGEGRPLRVEFPDGTSREVTAVHAWDRALDLAVIRVEGTGLPFLPLADSDAVRQGAPVVAMGNPLGFRFSVVEGVISARQPVEGNEMLQLAMPVERGNSGGPVLDREGRVVGIVTLKSAVTGNLGFAMPVNALTHLLESAAPIAMPHWLTIGALNPKVWKPKGADWSQRAGEIRVQEAGSGFGGRALCLHRRAEPELPREWAVEVRLTDESGAAGLAFCSDGGDLHYGFYPSGGKLRLTRFSGPDVYSWSILFDEPVDAYRPGEWNELRVRVEPGKIFCYVNGVEVFVSDDTVFRTGEAGLCKFRDTGASFRRFRSGVDLSGSGESGSAAVAGVMEALARGDTLTDEAAAILAAAPQAARQSAESTAAALERRALALRETAADAHRSAVTARLAALVSGREDSAIPLDEAALLLSTLDNPDIEPAVWQEELDRMAGEIRSSLTDEERTDPERRIDRLNRWMFGENGFHGSREDFDNQSNSYLNEVIDDREGLPITLSLVQMELGRRLDLDIAGIPMPGRFLTQLRLPEHREGGLYFDPYDKGRRMCRQDVIDLGVQLNGEPPADIWTPATRRSILARMLTNLTARAAADEDPDRMLRYLDVQLALDADAIPSRLQRLFLNSRTGHPDKARRDAAWLIEKQPPGVDLDQLEALLREL